VIDQFLNGQVHSLSKRLVLLRTELNERLTSLPERQQENGEYYANFISQPENDINELLAYEDFGNPLLLKQQIIAYRISARDTLLFEQFPLSLLYYFGAEDAYLCRFINRLCAQINYRYPPPIVCRQSNQSFCTHAQFNLIYSDLFEYQFLLTSPDLIHELGHIFFYFNNRKIFPAFLRSLHTYIRLAQRQQLRRRGLFSHYTRRMKNWMIHAIGGRTFDPIKHAFSQLEHAWSKYYLEEFACDIFATYLVGPPYGWSQLRLTLTNELKMYSPGFGHSGTHPSNEARMQVILLVLEKLESTPDKVEALTEKWEEYKEMMNQVTREDRPDANYGLCYPENLLEGLVERVVGLCEEMRLVPYYRQWDDDDSMTLLMQRAWERFLDDPEGYSEWETTTVNDLINDI
jgi:hypothetical protein